MKGGWRGRAGVFLRLLRQRGPGATRGRASGGGRPGPAAGTDACGAEVPEPLLSSSPPRRRGTCPAAPPDPPPGPGPPRASARPDARLPPGRPVLGWDGPLPSGRCPFPLFLRDGTYGRIHGHADKCVRRHPAASGAPGECPGCDGGDPPPGPGPLDTSIGLSRGRGRAFKHQPLTCVSSFV